MLIHGFNQTFNPFSGVTLRQSQSLIVLINKGQYRLKPNEIKYAVDEKPSAILTLVLALQVMTLVLAYFFLADLLFSYLYFG